MTASLPDTDDLNIEAQLTACRDKLKSLRQASSDDAAEVIAVLDRLAGITVDTDLLRKTGIGKEVNAPFVRTHENETVKKKSSDLIKGWKAAAGVPSRTATASAAGSSSSKPASEANREALEKMKADVKKDEEAEASKRKVEPSDQGSPTKKVAKKTAAAPGPAGPNEELAALFAELAGFEFKKKATFKGVAYKKVANLLREYPEKIESGTQVASLQGVGAQSVKKIDQYISTGTMERLEKYRSGDMDGAD